MGVTAPSGIAVTPGSGAIDADPLRATAVQDGITVPGVSNYAGNSTTAMRTFALATG